MKNLFRLPLLLATLCCVATWIPAASATAQSIELSGGLGYTAVDLDAWVGSGAIAQDWNQFMSQVYVQLHLTDLGPMTLGIEAGYQYFFWTSVRVPYGDFPIFRDHSTCAVRLMATGRLPLASGFFADLGAGAYLFEDWTAWGLTAALGRQFALTPQLSVPVKLRTSVVLDADAPMLPLGLSAGLAYQF